MNQHDRGIVALVLAAGRAKRFGVDKRGIELEGGKTLLEATVASVSPFFESVFVVVRSEDDGEAMHIGHEKLVRSLNADRGMGFSIADGFAALKHSQAVAAAVLLGDMPCIEPDTFSVLMEHAAADRIVRPEYHGRAGHPVIFGRDFWGELCQLQGRRGHGR
ncbi:nucleotidyltransferase family protein [Marinobacterium aestuariivivens]|uniref:Nucleotidyltransferase family protein n=1 Tax=Marinobacterium aestuariivivens TaxID=1698799 RepID=A0ABW1ZXD3_9GAMM